MRGIRTQTVWLLNLGIIFIAITSLARYFDSFLPALPNNSFLILGGLVLLAFAWFLRKAPANLDA